MIVMEILINKNWCLGFTITEIPIKMNTPIRISTRRKEIQINTTKFPKYNEIERYLMVRWCVRMYKNQTGHGFRSEYLKSDRQAIKDTNHEYGLKNSKKIYINFCKALGQFPLGDADICKRAMILNK